MKKALLIVDVQNDYFTGGKFPLWNTDATLDHIVQAIEAAKAKGVPIVLIQHVANPETSGTSSFAQGSEGGAIHPRILEAAPEAPVVVKAFADGFFNTNLEETLAGLGITDLLVCGMMTQNCVTHTAISRSAEKYNVTILPDCCTTVNEVIHNIALRAVSTRLSLVDSSAAI